MPSKILEFKSKKSSGRKSSPANGPILDEGTLGKLKYRVFKRGVIHIFNSTETLLFKKDCDVFESEIDKLKLNDLKDGENKKIEGSGDNDTLIFSCSKGDIEIELNRRSYGMLSKLKKILNSGKKK
jgi:hypothetical protein